MIWLLIGVAVVIVVLAVLVATGPGEHDAVGELFELWRGRAAPDVKAEGRQP